MYYGVQSCSLLQQGRRRATRRDFQGLLRFSRSQHAVYCIYMRRNNNTKDAAQHERSFSSQFLQASTLIRLNSNLYQIIVYASRLYHSS